MKTFVLNLDRRPDRLEAFRKTSPIYAERFEAVDGKICKPPHWWRATEGAWGCYRSHLAMIERAQGLESVLIFEDDCIFCDGFTARLAEFQNELPSDWEQFYLGGQHFKIDEGKPEKISEHVYRPYNIHRTHAYALRGKGLSLTYEWLLGRRWPAGWHVDHHLGRLAMSRMLNVYCPDRWLCGQAESDSDILDAERRANWWTDAVKLQKSPPAP